MLSVVACCWLLLPVADCCQSLSVVDCCLLLLSFWVQMWFGCADRHLLEKIGFLKNHIWQIPFKDFEEVIHKANRYSTLGIVKLENKNKTGSVFKAFFALQFAHICYEVCERYKFYLHLYIIDG